MDPYDALVIIAELALGIAGFSGVVVALGAGPGAWPRADRLRLATLLASALGTVFIALIGLTLTTLRFDLTFAWRVSGLLVALLLLVMLVTLVPGALSIIRTTAGMTSPYNMGVFIPTILVAVATILVEVANAAGMLPLDSFGVLFGGLVVLLLISAIQFVRLIFVARRRDGD